MLAFKITIIAVIISFILTFIYDYFTQDYVEAMKRFILEEDKEIIRNVFRLSIFCIILLSFMFYGLLLTHFI